MNAIFEMKKILDLKILLRVIANRMCVFFSSVHITIIKFSDRVTNDMKSTVEIR